MRKKQKIKFAVLMKDGRYFRVTEVARHPNNSGDDWVVVADKKLKKNNFLAHSELKNYQIVYSPPELKK